MNSIRERILETLNQNKSLNLKDKTREDIVENLLQYHEELIFQNEELRSSYTALETIQKKYEVLFDKAPMMYLYLDDQFEILEYNQLCEKYMHTIKKGKKLQDMIHPESQDTLYFHMRKLEKTDTELVDQVMLQVGGHKRYYKLTSHPLILEGNRYYQCTFADITDEIIQKKRIEYLSFHDTLTGLYNRRFFNEELRRLDHSKHLPVAIIMADVNGLKLMNDTFGHAMGDQLLRAAGKYIKEHFREDEVVARYGGDEFAVILNKVDKASVEMILKRLQSQESTLKVNGIHMSIAFGAAVKESADEPIQDILKLSEDRMYQKKLLMNENYHQNVIKGILSTLHEKHPREEQHVKRVREHIIGFTSFLDYDHNQCIAYETAGLVHDIGKIAIDYAVLDLPRRLTVFEYDIIKKHVDVGYRVLKSCGTFSEVQDIVLSHHERYDGLGYPRGIAGEDIPLGARILNLCDSYDAMISERPYKKAMPQDEAIAEIRRCSYSQFDPKLADLFISYIQSTQ